MKKNNTINYESGHTLVTILVFTVVALAVVTASVNAIITITRSTAVLERHIIVTQAAESGIENAILRLLRDPSYTGETLIINDITVIVTVTGSDPKSVTASSQYFGAKQTVEATATYNENRLTISSWNYVY